MDRRDALKRLGAVGVTAAAATLIVSSPAFADGGTVTSRPTVPGPPTLAATFGASAPITFAAAACPTVGPGPASARIDYSIYQVAGSGSLIGAQAPGVYSIGSALGDGSGRTATVDPDGVTFLGSITIRVDVRYVCREPGGPAPGVPAWRCRSWTRVYTYFGLGYSGAAWVEVTPTSCGTPT